LDDLLPVPAPLALWRHVDARTLIAILAFFLTALVVHSLASHLARPLLGATRIARHTRRPSPERERTLRALLANTLSLAAFFFATIFSLSLFVSSEALIWVVGLFSAAFGLGARPLVSDFLTGVSLLFEDTFAVGDKIELLGFEGVVEAVNLRTTQIRAPTGELYIVPNGEVRVVRNFSRGRFSTATVKVEIDAGHVAATMAVLEELATEALHELPALIEPWRVISESGNLGQQTELTIVAKTRFGQAADTRPRMLALIQARLSEAGLTR
jgi:small-conductance mechanosensitive channel